MHDSSGPHEFDLRSERRGFVSRRIGGRRSGVGSVADDRRRSNDRRGALDRREGASDHVRNALHMLGTIPLDEVSPDTASETIGAVKERLGLAMREIDGLLASLHHLSSRLDQHEMPPADD